MADSLPLCLNRRRFALGALTAAGMIGLRPSALAAADAPADNPGPIPPRIRNLYRRAVSIDCLGSPNTFNVQYPQPGLHLSPEQLRNIRASGLTAINMTVGGGPTAPNLDRITGIKADVDAHPDVLKLITRPADIDAAKKAGQLGIILGFQGIEWMQDDLSQIDAFAAAHVMIMQLTYNQESKIGSGSLSRDPQPGLEAAGRAAIEQINGLKRTVDLAHSHPQTALDAARTSKRPIIVSHTGCRAVYDHPRNQPDEVLKAVANGGGVTGLFIMPFLGLDTLGPTRALVTRHIVHALKVSGEDHVGIGTDTSITPVLFDATYRAELRKFSDARAKSGMAAPLEDSGLPFSTPGLNTPRRLEVIAADLAAAGVKDRVIEKVIGGNFHRVFRETWG